MSKMDSVDDFSLDQILEIDQQAREVAREFIRNKAVSEA
jgi:hypothetical protein